MNKRDFFFAACRNWAITKKSWVIKALSVVRDKQTDPFNYDIKYEKDGVYGFVDGDWVKINDVQPYTKLINEEEEIEVRAGEVPNLDRDVLTTYGDVLFNWRTLVYALGNKIPFVVGPIRIDKDIETKISALLIDDPLPGEPYPEGKITITEYKKWAKATCDLSGFSQILVPTGSKKSFTTDPRIRARRAELLEEHKDRLHDPAVIAVIQNELVAMDKKWLEGDVSEGFFIKDKQFNTARKRTFVIHGPETGFDETAPAELIVNSLDEGWDITKLPAMANSLRAGAYFRGALTALGGESVKFFMRIFQNTLISEYDCGVKYGAFYDIDKGNHDSFVGYWKIVDGGIEEITAENSQDMIGKRVEIRSARWCKTGMADYCQVCMGKRNSESLTSVGANASDIGSAFMYIMMLAAHAKELKTARVKTKTFLT